MHLGALITRLANEDDSATTLSNFGNIQLFVRVEAMARHFDESVGEYVAGAAGRFSVMAGDVEWMSLVAAVEKSATPKEAALERILEWALKQDAGETCAEKAGHPAGGECSCGS
mgnify:CR=1 FL=1